MNLRFFFVKNVCEYAFNSQNIKYSTPHGGEKTLSLKTPEEIKFAEKVLYKHFVKLNHMQLYPNVEQIYEGDIYGETGIEGLKIDFNFGLRLDIPEGNFHARISDFDSGTIFFDEDISNCRLISSEQYFIHWQVEIFASGEKVFEHILDLKNQPVLIVFPHKMMGDILANLPYAQEFQKIFDCDLKIFLPDYLREVAKNLYPEVEQVKNFSQEYYATFFMVANMGDFLSFPADSRTLSLTSIPQMILGLKTFPPLPKFTPKKKRKIKTPYVCIAVQASMVFKGWHYPQGWDIVVDYLKSLGYRVLCIDGEKVRSEKIQGGKTYTIKKPKGAEDFTGNIPLIDRANMLYYADFFIGLSSGLAWLANAVGCPVIMIAGFTADYNEFFTPYRVANRFVCNGCYNDISAPLFSENACSRYAGTEREIECQKKISPQQVIQTIEKLIADKNLQVN